MLDLEFVRETSEAGRLLERVLGLDWDSKRFNFDLEKVTCEDARALKILEQERNKWEKEESERKEEDQRMKRLMEDFQARGKR